MRIFVLYDKSGIHSGRLLGRHLSRNLAGKATVQRGRPERLQELVRAGTRFDYILNIGWYKPFDCGGALILNAPELISLSSNKRNARIKFKQLGIPAPQLWLTPKDIQPGFFPLVARTTHHTKGRGLWLCKNAPDAVMAAAAGATHFLKLIPNTREFRVHVMAPGTKLGGLKAEDYKILKLSEKVPNPNANPDEVIKNHESGWFFGYPKDKKEAILQRVREVGKRTVKEFGLHWGAVDIMVSKDTGEPYVLEINSTPCLTDDHANTLEKYSDAVCTMLGVEAAGNVGTPATKSENYPKEEDFTWPEKNQEKHA